MNRKIALYGLLVLLAGGSAIALSIRTSGSIADSTPAIAETTNPHAGHSMSGTEMPGMSTETHSTGSQHSDSHHPMSKTGEDTKATLIVSSAVAVKQPITLTIDVQDAQGKAIADFETFQEKLMHLIVVSNNLEIFQHLHPTYKGKGRFEVSAALPQPGSYTLISDYKPIGKGEKVSLLNLDVPGVAPTSSSPNFQQTKVIDATKVTLGTSEVNLKAEQEITLTFELKDEVTSQPIQDLKPYLGEQGHLVILRQASSLTTSDYVHAHAMRGTPIGKVAFITKFPQPGRYKLWGQFNRNGKIIVADFWVKVQ